MKEDKPVIIRNLTMPEARSLLQAQVHINRFKMLLDQYSQVEMNFSDFSESNKVDFRYGLTSDLTYGVHNEDQADLSNVNRLCKNYVFSYFNAVELMEKQIFRDFDVGINEALVHWDKLKRLFYNSYFEHRFIYQLRNFCHINNPINSIYEMNGKVSALCTKSDLRRLKQFDQQEVFKADWLRLGENFDFMPIAEKSISCLLDLVGEHLLINKVLFLPSANFLLNELSQFSRFKRVGIADRLSTDSKFVLEMPLDAARKLKEYYSETIL